MRDIENKVTLESRVNKESGLKRGQIYFLDGRGVVNDGYYILARMGDELFNLINLSNGNKYTSNLSESELERYMEKTGFILVKNNKVTIEC